MNPSSERRIDLFTPTEAKTQYVTELFNRSNSRSSAGSLKMSFLHIISQHGPHSLKVCTCSRNDNVEIFNLQQDDKTWPLRAHILRSDRCCKGESVKTACWWKMFVPVVCKISMRELVRFISPQLIIKLRQRLKDRERPHVDASAVIYINCFFPFL